MHLLSRAFKGRLVIPEFGQFIKEMTEIYDICKNNDAGKVTWHFLTSGHLAVMFIIETFGLEQHFICHENFFRKEQNIRYDEHVIWYEAYFILYDEYFICHKG